MQHAGAIERAAREGYGRLLAYLGTRTRDLASAEDALAEAFARALERWPSEGVPDKPEAWLLTTARRALIDAQRHDAFRARTTREMARAMDDAANDLESPAFPDDRLRLLFVCAHPAIDPALHAPLMLQTVLGLDANAIARAFVVAPAAMAQRLVRGKSKIRDAGVPFRTPERAEWPARLPPVLEAIYAAYGTGWEDPANSANAHGLAGEAIWLGRTVVDLMPSEPEALGLLALMLFCEARRAARRSDAGAYVPLDEQDPSRWGRSMFDEAERTLWEASRAGSVGRFQLEAAIQSAHMHRLTTGEPGWDEIVGLYDALVAGWPSVGAVVGRAAAVARARGAAAGLEALDAAGEEATQAYQPAWALRAWLLGELGLARARDEAVSRAVELASDPAVRAFLERLPGAGA
jgi:predicted RNA polymerase sigma factor